MCTVLGCLLRQEGQEEWWPIYKKAAQEVRSKDQAFACASMGWTLVVAQRDHAEQTSGFAWRRFDSLSHEHEPSHEFQVLLGTLFSEVQLRNSPTGSNACGFYVVQWMEKESEENGSLSGWKSWTSRLKVLTGKLLQEQDAKASEAKAVAKKVLDAQEQVAVAAQAKKASEKLKKLTNVT